MKIGEHYLEDFAVGQIFGSGQVRIDEGRRQSICCGVSILLAASSVSALTSSAGPIQCARATNCASRAKSLKFGHRNHDRNKD